MISEWDVPLFQQQGGSNITRWFVSHYDFRTGCDPLLQQGGTNKKDFHDDPQQQREPGSLLDLSANAAGKNISMQENSKESCSFSIFFFFDVSLCRVVN